MRPKLILILGVVTILISEIIVLSSYDFTHLNFCWSHNCLIHFIDYFHIPIQLAIGELYVFGFFIAIASLHQQSRSANAVNYAAHFDHFDRIVNKQIAQLDNLKDIDCVAPLLHAAFFPDYSILRIHRVSSKNLEQWQRYISKTSRLYGNYGSNEVNWKEHQIQVSRHMRSAGIYVEDIELDTFLRIERDCYLLFNVIWSIGGRWKFDPCPQYLPQA